MDWCHWGVIGGLTHNAVVCYANKTMYKEQKMSSERQFSSSDWCEWVIWRNTSGLFRNPQIAKQITPCYRHDRKWVRRWRVRPNQRLAKWRTHRLESCSIPFMFEWRFCSSLHRCCLNSWNFNWTRKCCYYRMTLPHCVTVGHSFAF